MKAPHFGTDGWRGVVAEDFTFENVERVARATAAHWLATPLPGTRPMVVVGYDRRFLSDRFAERVAEVMAASGLKVLLTDRPTPTPAVSLAVRRRRAMGGIMLTASHNPPEFNGFKLKAWFGGSAPPETSRAVEARLEPGPVPRVPLAEARKRGWVQLRDLQPALLRAVRAQVDFPAIARSGLRVAHDAMYGVGAGCFERLLAGTTCRVPTLRGEHDVLFGGIHPEPIPRYYAATARWLRAHPQDVCLVTDGDADRLGGLDGRGGALTTHQLISLLLEHFVANRSERGRVIKSVNTTSMVDALCAEHGLPLTETGIGFSRMCTAMRAPDVLLGVEESGGIGYPPHLPERDGLAAGMWLLELLAMKGRSVRQLLAALERRFGPHRYDRTGLRVPEGAVATIEGRLRDDPPARLLRSPVEQLVTLDGLKCVARDGSWLMFRRSGTEPLFRIYAEAASDEQVRRLLAQGRRLVRRCLA